jgi:hypothetical protein
MIDGGGELYLQRFLFINNKLLFLGGKVLNELSERLHLLPIN